MSRRNNPNALKIIFTLAQIVVMWILAGILLWVTALSHKEDVLEAFTSRLDASTETMANQLRANQVPTTLGAEGNGVFIINQSDGVVVIDKHLGSQSEQEQWQRYRTKLIYEMQKQKRGWIIYPEKKPWDVRLSQRVIRYMSIDELGWILAVEASRPTDWQLLVGAFKKTSLGFMVGLLLAGALVIWLINERYFYLVFRSVTDTVENNFMSLSGEDSIWDKFKSNARSPSEDLEKEALGLGFAQEKSSTVQPSPREVKSKTLPVIETLRSPSPSEEFHPIDQVKSEPFVELQPMKAQPQPQSQPAPVKEEPKPTVKPSEPQGFNQLTININDIKSPALKKIIQQFREK